MAVDNLLAALAGEAMPHRGRRDPRRRGRHRHQLDPPADRRRRATAPCRARAASRSSPGSARASTRTGRLGEAPQQRVLDVLARLREAIAAHGAQRATAVMTSAVRDAANGAAFAARVRDALRLRRAASSSGDEEARLTFPGATTVRAATAASALLVIDIGGGSTELVHRRARRGRLPRLDPDRRRAPHRAPPAHRPADRAPSSRRWPPTSRGDRRGRARARARARSPPRSPSPARRPSAPAIDLGLDRYDPTVEGHVLTRRALRDPARRARRAAARTQRREVPGLDPDRAPDDRRRRRDPAEVLAASASTRSRSPSATSCGAQRVETGRSTTSN